MFPHNRRSGFIFIYIMLSMFVLICLSIADALTLLVYATSSGIIFVILAFANPTKLPSKSKTRLKRLSIIISAGIVAAIGWSLVERFTNAPF